MFNFQEDDNSVTMAISSEMKMTDRVARESEGFLRQFGVESFSKYRIVLRELLINAIEHGNQKKKEKKVTCTIKKLEGPCFEINIQDEGKGFNYADLNLEMPSDPAQLRNRGYPLINNFCDEITFNKKGNQVTAYVPIIKETSFQVSKDKDESTVITPTGDVTASIADKLRVCLMELFDEGNTHYCFDLSNVQDIDSIGLSVLISFANLLKEKGSETEIRLVNSSEGLKRLFRLTRMDKTFEVS